MAKLVTVHLVLPYEEWPMIADAVNDILRPAELDGALVDWGFRAGEDPLGARDVPLVDYEEGDFYRLLKLEHP